MLLNFINCYVLPHNERKIFSEAYERYTPISINYVLVLLCLRNTLLKILVIQSKLSSVSMIYFQILCILFFLITKNYRANFKSRNSLDIITQLIMKWSSWEGSCCDRCVKPEWQLLHALSPYLGVVIMGSRIFIFRGAQFTLRH